MGELVHHELQRANAFAAEHADFLVQVFSEFLSSGGEWPEIERLQRTFERHDIDLDIGRLAWEMPKGIGFAEGQRVVLRLRALMHVPEAEPLLAGWHGTLLLAYQRWRESEGEDDAVLRWRDLVDELGLAEEEARLILKFLSRESWAFGGGGGDESDWWREVRAGVRVARGTPNARALIAARDAIEYPAEDVTMTGRPAQTPTAAQARILPAGGRTRSLLEMSALGSDVASAHDPDRERKVMVVVGRDDAANAALFDFLRAIDLKPLEWPQLVAETEHATPYIGQVLDSAMEVVQAVVVLFTPDDLVQLRPSLLRKSDSEGERQLTGQPRPNVLFEAGLAFGRHPKRTVLVEHGALRGLSDLFGRHVVRLERGASALKELAQRLESAGCRVDLSGESWLDAARFPDPPELDLEIWSVGMSFDNHVPEPPTDGLEPLARLLRDILIAAGHEAPDDVVDEVARRIAHLDGPTRGLALFEGLPGRMLPFETIKRVTYELSQHGVLRRNEGPESGFVLGTLP